MASALERLVEKVALRLASREASGLAMAARLPLPPLRTLAQLEALVRDGRLTAEERDGVRVYRSEATAKGNGCPGCGAALRGLPLCPKCEGSLRDEARAWLPDAAEAERLWAEHRALAALAVGGERRTVDVSEETSLTLGETEALLTALAGRGALGLPADPARAAWRAPRFECPAAWADRHRAFADEVVAGVAAARRRRLPALVARHPWRTALGALLLLAALLGVEALHLTSLRKGTANAYWNTFFELKGHEELLARYVGDDATREQLHAMDELDVAARLRSDRRVHDQVRAAHPNDATLLRDLDAFDRKFEEMRADYDARATEYRDALRSPLGRVIAFIAHQRTPYDPIPADAWKP